MLEIAQSRTLVSLENQILRRKREVNAHLPRLAEGYVCGELTLEDLVVYFQEYAHLYTVGIDVNAICNLSCEYCYLDAYNPTSTPEYADLGYFHRFLRELSSYGVDLVALVGKEPFADSRGVELLDFLNRLANNGRKFRFGVVTNGTLVHRYLDRLPLSTAYVDVSLDGPSQLNDSVRGNGVFKRAATNVRLLTDHGFQVWISSVLHRGHRNVEVLRDFLKIVSSEYGCNRFYFSPVRNFTGSLNPFLLSFSEITRLQDYLANLSELLPGIKIIILDHPYEAVWRDYFWPMRAGAPSKLDSLYVDGFGNVLDRLGAHCFRKLDMFPHGPWGTCRIDARGAYLPDVESRASEIPQSVGSIKLENACDLHDKAMRKTLVPMLTQFLTNMSRVSADAANNLALTTLSAPDWVI
jgi:pyruvate-formate lyase-activating enzyme